MNPNQDVDGPGKMCQPSETFEEKVAREKLERTQRSAELAEQLAKALTEATGAGWRGEPEKSPWRAGAYLIQAGDGLALHAGAVVRTNALRWAISSGAVPEAMRATGIYSFDFRVDETQEISVAASRSWPAIAKEIQRRLLPSVEAAMSRAMKRTSVRRTAGELAMEVVERLAAVLCLDLDKAKLPHDSETVRDGYRKALAQGTPVCLWPGGGQIYSVTVEPYNVPSIEIKLTRIEDVERAEAILRLVTERSSDEPSTETPA